MSDTIQMNLLPKRQKCPHCGGGGYLAGGGEVGGDAFQRDRAKDNDAMRKTDAYARRGHDGEAGFAKGGEAGHSTAKESFASHLAKRRAACGGVIRR